jgi:hypothetical protein
MDWSTIIGRHIAFSSLELKDVLIITLSLAAFVLSLWTLYLKNDDRVRTLRAQISDTIGKLLAAEAQVRQLNAEINNPKITQEDYARLTAQRQSLNDLRLSLAQLAIYFLNQKPIRRRNLIADAEYFAVARALADNNDIRAAEYWEKAIKHATPGVYQARLRAFYAEFLFRLGHYVDARRLYSESLQFGSELNDRLRWEGMFNYLKWAKSEADAGNSNEVEECFNNAKKMYDGIRTPDLVTRGRDRVLPGERAEIDRRLSKAREIKLMNAQL